MRVLTLCVVILFIGACSSSSKKTTGKLYYRLPEATPVSMDKSFVVKRPTAMGILGNRPMVAQTEDGGLKQMNNSFWLDSPRVLLQNYLMKLLTTNSDKESFVLNSQILKLEKQKNITSVEIKFVLSNLKGKEIFNKTYFQSKDMDSNSVSLFVNTVGVLLETITDQFVEDIR